MNADSKLKVLIAHGEPLVAAGLQYALKSHDEFEVAMSPARSEKLTSDAVPPNAIDVVLADCDTGVHLARSARATGYRILIVTQDESEASIRRAMEAGVRGYLLLGSTLEAVVQAVRCVVRGGTALDPVAATKMLDSLNGNPITKRELEVLSLLMLGLPDKVIAHRLGISVGTSKCHVKQLLTKLDADTRTEAVAIAQRRGLVPPETSRRRPASTVLPLEPPPGVDQQALRTLLRRSAVYA
jgi:DNA-binding NarL/FixJ family response regulator